MPATLPRRAMLGAELPADADAFTADGMWLDGVVAGSMAEHAGLAAGDCVRSIAGLPVRTLAELGAALRAAGAAATAQITFVRGGEQHAREVAVAPLPHESFEGIRVDYGELAVGGIHSDGQRAVERAVGESRGDHGERVVGGARLRTIVTHRESPRGVIAFVQGIACESIEHPLAPDAPLAGLVAAWTRAGFDTLRFDKRGVGDSDGGPCPTSDFATELADARAVVTYALAAARTRDLPCFVFGHSVGGIIAPQLARDIPVDGVLVYGTPVMRWLACLQDSARRQLALRGASDAVIEQRVAELARLAQTGELNGRSAAYHAQLDAVDIEASWRAVHVPILVTRGEYDWVVAADDQARIADLALGPTTIVDVAGLDHLFGHHADHETSLRDYGAGTFDPALADATLSWLARHV